MKVHIIEKLHSAMKFLNDEKNTQIIYYCVCFALHIAHWPNTIGER